MPEHFFVFRHGRFQLDLAFLKEGRCYNSLALPQRRPFLSGMCRFEGQMNLLIIICFDRCAASQPPSGLFACLYLSGYLG